MDDKEFENLKTRFYNKDWYSRSEVLKYMTAVLGKANGKALDKILASQGITDTSGRMVAKEYLVCLLATALDATHETDPHILNNKRWIICRMKHYDKQV